MISLKALRKEIELSRRQFSALRSFHKRRNKLTDGSPAGLVLPGGPTLCSSIAQCYTLNNRSTPIPKLKSRDSQLLCDHLKAAPRHA